MTPLNRTCNWKRFLVQRVVVAFGESDRSKLLGGVKSLDWYANLTKTCRNGNKTYDMNQEILIGW